METMTKPKRGYERREMTANELGLLIRGLRDTGLSKGERLAGVLITHRMLRDEVGYVELGKKMWAEIDELLSGQQMEANDSPIHLSLVDRMVEIPIEKSEVNEPPDAAEERAALERQAAVIAKEKADIAAIEAAADAELDLDAQPECRCGCGGRTKGGRYLPGHDAKHKGILMRRVYYGSSTDGAIQTPEAQAAWIELNIRGWSHFYDAFARNEAKRERRSNQVTCRVCNRPLYDEESVAAGIGPVCQGHN